MLAAMLTLLAPAHTAEAPSPRPLDEVRAVLARAPASPDADRLRELRVVLLADAKDHGDEEHDYPLWQQRWHVLLGGSQAQDAGSQLNLHGPPADPGVDGLHGAPRLKAETAWHWPTRPQWESADVVVAFCYLPWNEERFREVETYLARGGGLVLVHSATWTMPEASPRVAALTGVGGFTRYRHGPVQLELASDHPICLGLPARLSFLDETYWPPTPAGYPGQIQVLASSDEKVGDAPDRVAPQPVFWAYQKDRGRVFGCVLGHYTWTFDDPYFRLLLLRGLAWSAGESPYRLDTLALRGARVVP
jgi:type 1 glutamine amidotransferase